jgi:hypothetical protein
VFAPLSDSHGVQGKLVGLKGKLQASHVAHAAPDPQLLRIHRTNSAEDVLDGSSVSTLSRLFV